MSSPSSVMMQMLRENNTKMLHSLSIKDFGAQLLHNAVPYPEVLSQKLETLADDPPKRDAMLQEKDYYGRSLLQNAAAEPKSLKIILDLYPKDKLLEALNEKNPDGKTLWHFAACNPHSLTLLSHYFSKEQLLLSLKERDNKGHTALYYAVSRPHCLQIILNYYPDVEKLIALEQKDYVGMTLLHLAVHYPDSFALVLNCYPEQKRLAALLTQDKGWLTPLFLARNSQQLLQIIHKALPEQQWQEAMTKPGTAHNALLYCLTNIDAIEFLLKTLPLNQSLELITKKGENGTNYLFEKVNDPNKFKRILNCFPGWLDDTGNLSPFFAKENALQNALKLFEHICQLKVLGQSLAKEPKSKDRSQKIVALAEQLDELTRRYIELKQQNNLAAAATHAEFKTRLRTGYKDMRTEGEVVLAVLLNIAIAATGIGLLVIVGKLLATKSAFFMQNSKQKKINEIEHLFEGMVNLAAPG